MSESRYSGPVRRSRKERGGPYSTQRSQEKENGGCETVRPETPPRIQPGIAEQVNERTDTDAKIIGDRYLFLENLEGSNLKRAIDLVTKRELACRAVSRQAGASILQAHFRLEFSQFVAQPVEIVSAGTEQFIFYQKNFGDLHGLVRDRLVRDEEHARVLLYQIVNAVYDCHCAGIVLTDLKMRRFVFTDKAKTKIVLETLEDATILQTDNDVQSYRRVGHPAYLSPEAICSSRGGSYSGFKADIWGLGVIIYTVLIGRYPFNDQNPLALFSKILQGHYYLPDDLSSHAKCMIRNLLRKDPFERLTAEDLLAHPWFAESEDIIDKTGSVEVFDEINNDQIVPSAN
ncbi:tribbles homolog 2-like [Artemia franciscana]|uniref:Protein kinase domain-containing protein n=1 Tax=Artemia franciscana TaxID=6661 RepID=A0AA88ICU0_ARTSF|nr:hypothetical protein QYM36_000298 [Artemia franciscana]